MATEIGTGTSYPITIPAGTDAADIQTALRYISYGIGGTPSTNSDITSNSIFGKMSLLAPKAGPVFTGNGSISGNFSIGGNLTITGSIDVLSSTTALIKDKKVILGSGDVTTDAGADGGGIQLSGTTAKTLVWIDGTDSWTSSENIDLATTKNYKIAGTTVLTSTAVLGLTGTNIATLSGTQTITGAKTFSGNTQIINGVSFDTDGGISRALVNNEWVPLVVHKPTSPVVYTLSSYTKLGEVFAFTLPDGNDTPVYYLRYRLDFLNPNIDAPLLPGQTVFVFVYGVGNLLFTIDSSPLGYLVAITQSAYLSGTELSLDLFVYDYYTDTSIQEWKYGGVNGTVAAQITSDGTVEALNGFKDLNKTYHTNASVPRASFNVQSGNLFSASTAPTSPVGWANTPASSSTGSTTAKWYATDPASPTVSNDSRISYSSSSGSGGLLVQDAGLYHISASATVSSTAVTGTLMGVYVVSADGTRRLPIQFSNIGVSNSTHNINFPLYLNAGDKVGIAIRTASAVAVALKNTDGSFALSAHLIG